ncbi:glycosyltransferase family 87 protein [Halovenus marina]|uniref:glycosyltransferase family 87 protein n=1 Tax=Halovenus marina TaxID=3396621 RepID=UPI003F569044
MSLPSRLNRRLTLLGRPLFGDRAIAAWIILAASFPLGLDLYLDNPRIGLWTWDIYGSMGVNYHVYHVAAEAAMEGANFYQVHPPGHDAYYYLYPPITALTWIPFTLFEWSTGYTLLTVLSVLAAVLATVLIVRFIESHDHRLGWLDCGLILGIFLLSKHAYGSIFWGNINILLGGLFALGFWGLYRDREVLAGVVFAVAALFKIFPALVGLWFLRDHRWTATAVALLTGVAGLIGGVVLFGLDTSVFYFTDVLLGRSGSDAFIGGYPPDGFLYVTFQRPLSHLIWWAWPSAPYVVLPALSAGLSALILYVFYVNVDTLTEQLMALLATTVVTMLIYPSLQWYAVLIFFPLIALVYLWRDGWERYLFYAAAILFSFNNRPSEQLEYLTGFPEPLQGWLSAIVGAATFQTIGMSVMLFACAVYKLRVADDRSAFDPRVQVRALWAWLAPRVRSAANSR